MCAVSPREGEEMRTKTKGSGFSFIEILIVLGVLSILAIVFTV
jgi:prepilin-type N-terminal cleavage/methylation domain-containing protein